MLAYILFTVGLLVRAVSISLQDFKKKDLLIIVGGIFLGLVIVGQLAEEYEAGDWLYPWIGLPIGFSIAIAFGFKQRILSVVSEGTVLLYGLVGGYIFLSHMLSLEDDGTVYNAFILLFVSGYLSMAFVAAFTSFRLGLVGQVLYMIMLMVMSVGIGVWMVSQSFGGATNTWGLVFIGYSSLVLLANVYYVLYFIPYTAKHQSFSSRIENIRLHASELEEKYIDVDLPLVKFLVLIMMVGCLFLLHRYTAIGLPVLAATVLSVGFILTKPSHKNIFIPKTVYDKL
jgi:hypothetical protein